MGVGPVIAGVSGLEGLYEDGPPVDEVALGDEMMVEVGRGLGILDAEVGRGILEAAAGVEDGSVLLRANPEVDLAAVGDTAIPVAVAFVVAEVDDPLLILPVPAAGEIFEEEDEVEVGSPVLVRAASLPSFAAGDSVESDPSRRCVVPDVGLMAGWLGVEAALAGGTGLVADGSRVRGDEGG